MDDTNVWGEVQGDKYVFECMSLNGTAKDVNEINDNVIQRTEN